MFLYYGNFLFFIFKENSKENLPGGCASLACEWHNFKECFRLATYAIINGWLTP